MRSSNRPYLLRLDVLRGVAAWWVVLFHCVVIIPTSATSITTWSDSWNPLALVLSGGWIAVSLFMVVSGFSIALGLRGHSIRWSGFFSARWLRIAPLYLLLLAIGIVVGAPTVASSFGIAVDVPTSIAKALTMLPFGDAYTPMPWLATSWSVRVEFAVYFFVPLIVFLLARFGVSGAALVVLACVAVMALSVVLTGKARGMVYFGVPGRLAEFAAGFCLAYFAPRVARLRQTPLLAAAATAGLLVVGVATTKGFGGEGSLPAVARVGFFFVVLCCCLALVAWAYPISASPPLRVTRALARLGTWSYSTYMWHYAVLILVGLPVGAAIAARLGGADDLRLVVTVVLTVGVTLAVSWASFSLVERPFLRWRPRYISGSPADSESPAAAVR